MIDRDPNEPWLRTPTGRVFHPLNPTRDEIFLEDIAIGLSKQCRYNGGIKANLFYTVAEHSVILADYVQKIYPEDPMLAFQALMHDAAETYIGDIVRPVKTLLPDFKVIEANIEAVIFEKFAVAYPWPDILNDFDTRILLDEEDQALVEGDRPFDYPGATPLGVTLHFWERAEAKVQFFLKFSELSSAVRFKSAGAAERRVVG